LQVLHQQNIQSKSNIDFIKYQFIMSTNQSNYQDDSILPQEQQNHHHHHHQEEYLEHGEDGQLGQQRTVPQTGEPLKDRGVINHLM
jgi:hypothetical protein